MWLALLGFALWAGLLAAILSLEHTAFGQWLFHSRAGTTTYLVLQGLLTVAALVASMMTFVRGPTRHRLIVLIPTMLLVLYGLMFITGPG